MSTVRFATISDVSKRDPRIDPMPRDVIRVWNRNFTIDRVAQGLIRVVSETGHSWEMGILGFRAWAEDAEVMHIDPATPPALMAPPEGRND